MAKSIIVAAFLLAGDRGRCGLWARQQLTAPELAKPAPGQLLDKDYLTSTGETVPRPGVPQGSGPTPLDRKIQQENNQIDNSICKGC